MGRGRDFDPPIAAHWSVWPTLDQTLLDVNEMILDLKAAGVSVELTR